MIFMRKIGMGIHDYKPIHVSQAVDWASGCCLFFPKSTYIGFDIRYYLYCEDADMCRSARLQGIKINYVSNIVVKHIGAKMSHRKLKYFIWHITSLTKYFIKWKIVL